jgi:hypothetical protein
VRRELVNPNTVLALLHPGRAARIAYMHDVCGEGAAPGVEADVRATGVHLAKFRILENLMEGRSG